MSATLGESGELERVIGASKIKRLPMVSDWDKKGLGRKLFIFPDLSFSEEDHGNLILKLHSKTKKSVILVPSNDDQTRIMGLMVENSPNTKLLSANDLIDSKEEFVSNDDAMVVIANRFDGIDFPDEESRMLIVYNLPKVTHLQEKFFYSKMAASILFSERIKTRIVQAVGRCTRNASDYAVVCILGNTILNELVSHTHINSYKPEMRAEIKFGIINSTGLSDESDLLENIDLFLNRNEQWKEAEEGIVHMRDEFVAQGDDESRKNLFIKLHLAAEKEVKLQYCLWKKYYQEAFDIIQSIIAELDAPALRGYKCYWQYVGGSIGSRLGDGYNNKSMQLFKDAAKGNLGVTWLAQLVNADDEESVNEDNNYFCDVAERIEEQLVKVRTGKKFEAKVLGVINGINEESGKKFENSHKELGEMLGYISANSDTNSAPDPYWIINEDICIVAEDKIYASEDKKIPTDDVAQAKRHEDWIRENVRTLRKNAKIYTVFISNSSTIEEDARTFAKGIFYCNSKRFADWANNALNSLRACNSTFVGIGDAEWRLKAQETFEEASTTPLDFISLITKKTLDKL